MARPGADHLPLLHLEARDLGKPSRRAKRSAVSSVSSCIFMSQKALHTLKRSFDVSSLQARIQSRAHASLRQREKRKEKEGGLFSARKGMIVFSSQGTGWSVGSIPTFAKTISACSVCRIWSVSRACSGLGSDKYRLTSEFTWSSLAITITIQCYYCDFL